MIAPFKRKRRTIAVDPSIRDLFRLIQSESWPAMMEKYLDLDPGTYPVYKPPIPGYIPPRRTKAVVNAPSTPSNDQGPSVCGNCQCLECPGPCLSPLSRPPHCDSCGFRHGPTYAQCSSTPTSTTTTDNVDTAIDELSPYSPLRSTTPTSTSTVDAIDAAIAAQTIAADFDGDFFSYCDNIIDEANDLCL